jgi:hypothetical protein
MPSLHERVARCVRVACPSIRRRSLVRVDQLTPAMRITLTPMRRVMLLLQAWFARRRAVTSLANNARWQYKRCRERTLSCHGAHSGTDGAVTALLLV